MAMKSEREFYSCRHKFTKPISRVSPLKFYGQIVFTGASDSFVAFDYVFIPAILRVDLKETRARKFNLKKRQPTPRRTYQVFETMVRTFYGMNAADTTNMVRRKPAATTFQGRKNASKATVGSE